MSKFAVRAELFRAEPPINPKDVKALFCGRDMELRRGIETLKASFDINGKKSRQGDKWPWVIHGESRSGKSHLARRIIAEFPPGRKRIQFLVTAKERLEAMTVMRRLFEHLEGEFSSRITDERLDENPFQRPQVQWVRQLIEKIALFEPDVQTVTLTTEQSNLRSSGIGAELNAAPLLSKFIARRQTEAMENNALQLNLRPPTPASLAEVCGVMIETLLTLGLINHALILVDDVDLLETYKSPTENSRRERSVLAMALDDLHGAPGVDVILTARSWYVHSNKELMQLVDLSLSDPMSPDEMTAIHNARLKVYGKNRAPFLREDALRSLADDVDGLPGVFLQHLDTAFYQFQNEASDDARDFHWLIDVFRQRIDKFTDRCGPAVKEITQAIANNQLSIDVARHNPFFGTVLDNEFVFQSYWSEHSYFISGFTRKILSTPESIPGQP
uniref:AAA ATPase domain-containing protein n=1 Tax=Candidatus Kentrum sp. LFY TaxID=2126342 RepID=A0A450X0L8_9GAMM|nr:MAG: hypothetical protein BECKLFY1418C_GA0070996_11285 [Candidatus Kentron sp. LFY]